MAEKEQKTQVINPATVEPSNSNPLPSDVTHYEPPVGMECHRIKTTSEKIFDASVYSGIGWFGNAALSTSIAYYLKYSASGKQKFEKVVTKIAELFNKDRPNIGGVMKNAEFFSLVIGGTMLMYPLKKLEDHKVTMVRGIDKVYTGLKSMVGIKQTNEDKLEKEAAFELLAQEPKQNWGTILRARFVGLAVALGALNMVGKENNNAIEGTMSKFANSSIKKAFPNNKLNPEIVDKVSRLATMDVIYSFVAAAGLYVDSHFINRPRNKRLQEGTFNPLNPPNEELNWVGRAHLKPAKNFQDMVGNRESEPSLSK